MEKILDFVKPELFVLIPVLYIIGVGLKKSQSIKDTRIPLALGLCGVAAAMLYVLATTPIPNYQEALMAVFVALTQGVLCAGASVYANQLVKQHTNEKAGGE